MTAGGPEVEFLDTRPPRPPRSRRALLFVAVLAVAAMVALLVQRGTGHPSAARTPAAPSTTTARSSTAPGPTPAPPEIAAAVLSPELAVDRIGDTLYAVDGGALVTIDLDTGRRFQWADADPIPADRYRLLTDPADRRVWLVVGSDDRTVVDFLDPATLVSTGQHVAAGQFVDATVLDGRLYLVTTAGVSVVGDVLGARPPAVGVPLSLAADPVRHRLLSVDVDLAAPTISAWSPTGGRPLVRAKAPFGKGAVVSAGRYVWAAGFGRAGGVLARLDPATLRVVRHSAVERLVGVGALVVGADARHLLVRSAGGTVVGGAGPELWCVDAASGAVRHHWGSEPGTAVLTDGGVVLLQAGNPLIRLPSDGCTG